MQAWDDNQEMRGWGEAPGFPLEEATAQSSDAEASGTLANVLGMPSDAKGHGKLGGLLSGKLGDNRYEVGRARFACAPLLRRRRHRRRRQYRSRGLFSQHPPLCGLRSTLLSRPDWTSPFASRRPPARRWATRLTAAASAMTRSARR